MTTTKQTRVAVIYKRDSSPDQDLVGFIEQQLAEQGCEVFIDRYLTMGVDWAREIEARIRSADAVVPLLSADSIHSEMLAFEIESAHEASQLQRGPPTPAAGAGELYRAAAGAAGQHSGPHPVFPLGRRARQPGPGNRTHGGHSPLAASRGRRRTPDRRSSRCRSGARRASARKTARCRR